MRLEDFMMFDRLLLLLAITLAALVSGPAQAWRHGAWWGPGLFVAIPPPVYNGSPSGDYPAPRPAPPGGGCYARAYVCPLDQPGPRGAPCSCPTDNGRVWGRIG